MQTAEQLTRRTLLGRGARALGPLALSSLLSPRTLRAAGTAQSAAASGRWTGVVNPLHFPARAKRVIWLYMAGGMSHLETFDPKPKLAEMHGQPMPESITKGQQIAQLQGSKLNCFAPQHEFKKYGKSGQEISTDLSLARRNGGRRDVHRPLAAYRSDQSRSGPHVHEHGFDDPRPAGRRFLVVVRTG